MRDRPRLQLVHAIDLSTAQPKQRQAACEGEAPARDVEREVGGWVVEVTLLWKAMRS